MGNVLNRFKKKKTNILYQSLEESDIKLYNILNKEYSRQKNSLELIASENYTSTAVLEANGNIFTNKYAEGYPNRRYYGGCQYIDELELLTQDRALIAFNLDPTVWGVNVQALSGSAANFAVYAGLLNPGDKLMGMKLTHGGHLTHGASTPTGKKLSNSSIFFNALQYSVDIQTGLIDYDKLHEDAIEFQPKLIIVGASAYPRDYDFIKFKKTADTVGAYLMTDMAHTAGLIASNLMKSPFLHSDIVTTTTHKTLRGPRGALIFYKLSLKDKIDFSVFPGTQGGAHYNTISAICTALKQVDTIEFKEYSQQVISNASFLSKLLKSYNFNIITNGTENHLILIDLKNYNLTGSKFEKISELCGISLNKNTVASDKSALNPSGIRIGTAAMTSRGFKQCDFKFVADKLYHILAISIRINNSALTNKLIDFNNNIKRFKKEIDSLKVQVNIYCNSFDMPTNN